MKNEKKIYCTPVCGLLALESEDIMIQSDDLNVTDPDVLAKKVSL